MKNNCSIQFSRIPNRLWLSSKKIPRTMKLFTLFFACSLGLAHASESYAQKAIVNVEVQNKTVGEILKEIEKQSEFDFFFDNTLIDLNRRVSVTSRNGDIFKVLEKVFKGTNVKYSILDKKIVLTTNADNTQTVQQITFKVIGKVVDNMGESVIGATVLEQGTTNGTVTDMDGNFELVVSNKEVTLEISYIGYSKSVVKSKVGVPVTVTLKEDTEVLDEVVVVGYGTQKKVNLTGAVSQVGEKALESRPVQNVSQALQGLVPGMTFGVDAKGGQLNNTPSVSIRGAGTIGKGSTGSPLILIDGVEGNMNLLNPLDIESISVLKDASASSIYGSRAPFGVILITTKQGKTGKPVVSYNTNIRFNSPLTDYDMMDSYRFMHYYNDARTNGGQAAYFSDEQIANVLAYQRGEVGKIIPVTTSNTYTHNWANANTDWYDVFFKDHAMSQEHSLSLSGGTERFSYYLSGNFMDQEGLLNYADESYYRYSVNGKINAKINKNISLSYNTKWFRTNYEAPSYLNQLFFHQIMRKWPNAFVTDPQGYWADNSEIIPLKEGGRMKEDLDQNFQQLQLDVTPLPGWNIHLQGNMRITTNFTHTDRQAVYAHDANGEPYAIAITNATQPGQSRVIEKGTKNEFYTVNLFSDYSRQLGDHYFKVMGGFNAEHQNVRTLSAQRDGIIVPDLPTIDTSTEQDVAGGGYNHWATAGFFGRLNYNYKEKYILEGTIRRDGSSVFGEKVRWATFPSVSAGWAFSEEPFMKRFYWLSFGKLRGSWGTSGQKFSQPYLAQGLFSAYAYTFLGQYGMTANKKGGLINRKLSWESTDQYNLGLDLDLMDYRFKVVLDYYYRYTKDQLNQVDLPGDTYLFDMQWQNVLETSNEGIELELQANILRETAVKWRMKLTASRNWSRFEKSYTGMDYKEQVIGKPLYQMRAYKTDGFYNTMDEVPYIYLASGVKQPLYDMGINEGIFYPGTRRILDLNGDGQITEDDQYFASSPLPQMHGGIFCDLRWKDFDLSMAFNYSLGRHILRVYDDYSLQPWETPENSIRVDLRKVHAWENENTKNPKYPRLQSYKNNGDQFVGLYDSDIENIHLLRLKQLTLGYNLNENVSKKFGLSSARIYVTAENLFLLSNYSGLDPEIVSIFDGIDALGSYPLPRKFTIGLSVNF